MARTPRSPEAPDANRSASRRSKGARPEAADPGTPPGSPPNGVEEASIESMIASDPPSFTGTVAGHPDHEPAPFDAPPAESVPRDEEQLAGIREHAYRLWEQAGRPRGRELEFWLQAERELDERRR